MCQRARWYNACMQDNQIDMQLSDKLWFLSDFNIRLYDTIHARCNIIDILSCDLYVNMWCNYVDMRHMYVNIPVSYANVHHIYVFMLT